MRQIKKMICSLIVFCLIVSLVPIQVFAEESVVEETVGEITVVGGGTCGSAAYWTFYSNGVMEVTGTGAIYSYNSPLHTPWGSNGWQSEIEELIISEGITTIGRYAFSYCDNLKSITIPSSLTRAYSYAFDSSGPVEEIHISDISAWCGINWDNPISKKTKLYLNGELVTDVILQEGITTIRAGAFEDYTYLKSISIPASVTTIGEDAMNGCTSLETVILSEGLVSIGVLAFYECYKLTDIQIPSSVQSISDFAFADSGLESITLSEGLIQINEGAFSDCRKLQTIRIPASVNAIASDAFHGCSSLTAIWVDKNNVSFCNDENGVLFSKTGAELLQFPGGISGSYIIPDNTVKVGDYAFWGCNKVTAVSFPDSLISIGKRAFNWCSGLIEIIIPDGVTEISEGTFFDCSSMVNITIPTSVISIGDNAFDGCTTLEDVYYEGTQEQWAEIDFGKNNTHLVDAIIHYNGSNPKDESVDITTYVRYFTSWDATNQIAYFDGDTIIGSQVTGETDTSFLKNVDSLVGQYVLVETSPRKDNMIAPDTLISIKPVETKTGIVSDADTDSNTITINDVTYDVNMSRVIESADGSSSTELVDLSAYVDEFVLYHIYDGKIVGIETLKTTEGMLTYWNAETREIKITHEDRTTTTYTLSEMADADTVALLGETGYFEFDVAYVTDSNSFLYQITRTPVIDFAEGYVLTAYFDRRDLSVQCNEELEFVCVLYYDGLPQEDWNKPVFTTSNENVLSVTACEKTDSGYCLTVKGGQPGTATVTVTDANSGAYVDFNVEVREAGVLTYSYLIDEVPSFYPDVLGDRETQTNFYNVNGLYVNGFPEAVYKFDGKYRLSFTVYNSTNMYGSVDVYDENGKWYSSQRIDKHTSITGLWDTTKGAFFLLYDGMEGRFISYTAHSCSTPTEIDIEVPEGGYFTISNNFVESPGTYIYNTVDFMMIGVDMLTDLAFSSADTKVVQEQTVSQILQTPDAYETFLVSFKDIAQDMVKEVTKQGYGDAVEAFTLSAFDMFDDMQLDFMGVVELACNSAGNVAVGAFEKCTPPAIGGTLKGMFAINKYLDRLYQVKDVYTSEDKPYIRLYTPEATGGLTISGITVAPTDGALPDNAVLQVFRIANTEALIVSDEGLVADQYELYNICFTVNNVETQPNGTVTVKIPVPANYNSEKCIVLHQQEDGNWRTVESKIEQGFIVFEVDHFCQFAVVDTSTTTEESTAGDINGDGKVNGKDGVLLAQYLAEWDVTINMDAADVNGDGKVNGKDGVLLAQYLAEWDVEIH